MLYKKYVAPIIITIIIGCIFISGCLDIMNGGGKTNTFITYENTKYEVIIKYPDTWAKLEYPPGEILVTFMPDEDNARRGEFNVSVFVYNSSDMELFWQTHTKELSQIFTDFNMLYRNSTILADKKGYTQLFTFRDSGYTFKRLEIGTIVQGRVYLLSYQADLEYYAQYTDSVEQMIDSFEIKAEW